MTIWSIHCSITNLVTAPFIERRALCPVAILAKNLLFWHVQINQCAEPTLKYFGFNETIFSYIALLPTKSKQSIHKSKYIKFLLTNA